MGEQVDSGLFDSEERFDHLAPLKFDGTSGVSDDIQDVRDYIKSEVSKLSANRKQLVSSLENKFGSIDKQFDILVKNINRNLKKLERAYRVLNEKLIRQVREFEEFTDKMESRHNAMIVELEKKNIMFKKIIEEQEVKLHTSNETLKRAHMLLERVSKGQTQ